MADQSAPASAAPNGLALVGRDRELATLRDALSDALAGRGSLVLVGGEAGVGKTALAEQILGEATGRGALALVGRCYDLSETPPYGPWAEALARLAARGGAQSLPAPLGDGAPAPDGAALFARARAALADAATRRPLMLLLDDVHWADPASLDLLRHLARGLADLPILLLATYRADELARDHPLYRLLPALVREGGAGRLALRPLDLRGVAALVATRYPLDGADAGRLVAYLDRRAEGNPFFVGELLHALEEGGQLRPPDEGGATWALGDLALARLPSLVRQVIDGRAARLGDEARGLLAVASVLGQVVPLGHWAALAGVDEGALLPAVEAAADARLVDAAEDGGSVRFAHALVRETLYTGIPPARRRAWHRRAGEILTALPSPAGSASERTGHHADPEAVAYHFQRAGDARAVEWLGRAGERARDLYAPQSAIEHLTRALDLARQLGLAPSASLHRERGLAHETAGDFARAQADQEAALALAHTAGDRRAEWRALLDLGQLWAGRDYARTEEYSNAALALARALNDPAILAHSLNCVGNWHVNADEPFLGEQYQREALAIFRQLGDRRGIAATIDQLGMASFLSGDMHRAADRAREAAALFRQLDDRQALASTLTWLCECGGWTGGEATLPTLRPDESRRHAEEGLRLAREIGWPAGEAFALLMLATSFSQQGEYAHALTLGHRGLALAEEIGHGEWQTEAHFRLGAIHGELLDAAALRHLERALDMARALDSRCLVRLISGVLASLCVERGDLAGARSLLTPALLGPDVPPHTAGQRRCRLARAELACAEGDPALALRIADRLVPDDADGRAGRVIPHLWRARARALAALGRTADALADLEAARHAAERGDRPILWRLYADAAAIGRAAGQHAAATADAATARALVEELASRVPESGLREQFLREAAARLTHADPPPASPAPAGYPAGLTVREVEVLRLVAEGLTDAEVAARLSLSPRTVNTHLRSIYGKLDVPSRTAAARFAAEHNLA